MEEVLTQYLETLAAMGQFLWVGLPVLLLSWALGVVPIVLFYAAIKCPGAFLEWRDKRRRARLS